MEDFFKTVLDKKETEIIEKKSKFISNISPVETEGEAIKFISNIKKKYFDARHNCFAYIIKDKVDVKKFSDDGEPSRTAGKPILDILVNENIKNVVIVVTRYFGGVLLGTGGLVKAYTKSAKEVLNISKIVKIKPYYKIKIITDYHFLGKIQYECSINNFIIKDVSYTNLVEIIVYVNVENKRNFIKNIKDLTNSKAIVEEFEMELIKFVDEKPKI